MLQTLLKKASGYSVLVIGDAIIDEYVYVKPQGKSPKENLITHQILRTESFRGGVEAAAAHLKDFCWRVDVEHGAVHTLKRRFVEATYLQKLFEVQEPKSGAPRCGDEFSAYDLIVVTDFGHGYIDKTMIEQLTGSTRFLAVNAQTNSSNHGFNLITKYRCADYVVLDELEARLAARDRDSPIEDVIRALGFPRIVVTLGPQGSIGYHDGEIARADSVSRKVVDTMGAGDAFFCVTAPLAAAGADIETLCKVGNAAGAVKCGVVGHRQAVTKESLLGAL